MNATPPSPPSSLAPAQRGDRTDTHELFDTPADAAAFDEGSDDGGDGERQARTAPTAPRAGTPSEAALAAWIERIVERDERALAALYDATLSRVYGLVFRLVRRPALAEEVVEDTYFQVWRQAVRFDPTRGRALTWLLGMARTRAIDAIRHEARFRHDSLEDDEACTTRSDTPPADDLLEAARGHAELHRALLRLQAQPRQLVALAFFRGLSHEEIAVQTQLPLGTVKSQIRRAMVTLRHMLGEGSPPMLAA
jgi:RNA polymerase sigma-70 factor (ECF subfamily)